MSGKTTISNTSRKVQHAGIFLILFDDLWYYAMVEAMHE